jgi:hypothetical protein
VTSGAWQQSAASKALAEQLQAVGRVLQAAGPEGLTVTASQLEELRTAAGAPLHNPAPVLQAPRQCLAACLATLTGLPAAALALPLPEHATGEWLELHGARLWTELAGRLAYAGWLLIPLAAGEVPRGFAVAVGLTAGGTPHAVVYRDGELWHDPAPGGAPLVEVRTFAAVLPLGARSVTGKRGV